MTWDILLNAMARWQGMQFPKATTLSSATHLRKEMEELTDQPDDVEEWADVLHLAIQGGTKAAGSLLKFREAVESKLDHNEYERTWPSRPDADNVYEHVKE